MKKILFALALVLAFSVSGVAYASHAWGNYHWARTANPFTLKLGDNVGSSWDAYLNTASSDWNASSVLHTAVVPGLVSARTCKGTAGRVEVCNASYGNNGWLGIASIWADSNNHITKGTAKMNDSYFNTSAYNTPAWRRLVMCQEVAHTFGLDHQDTTFGNVNLGTCMDYTNAPAGGVVGNFNYGPSNEHPNAHDYEELGIIYGHVDAYKTLAAALGSVSGALKNAVQKDEKTDEKVDSEDWGTAIGHDAKGRANKFSKKDGEQTKVTEVFWLPE